MSKQHRPWKILNGNKSAHLLAELEPLKPYAQIDLLTDDSKLPEILGNYDLYITALRPPFKEEYLDNCRNLKAIATPTTGLDHLPAAAIRAKGITLIGLRENPELLKKVTSTAEMAWTLLLALLRHIPEASQSALSGKWDRDRFIGTQLSGKTMGIIGYGRLGRMVGRFAKAFGMKVYANDTNSGIVPEDGVEMVSLEKLLRESDAVSIHIHLDPVNVGFFDRPKFELMKKSAVLINTSRGAVINEADFLHALESGMIAGAAVDVIAGEGGDLSRNCLIRYAQNHSNMLITPHCGGASYEAQCMTFADIIQRVKDYIVETGDPDEI